jgi:beta-galactosidase/beta-glucuronidase
MEALMSADDSLANWEPTTRPAALSLDGFWDFAFEGPTARLAGESHEVRSPGIWQIQFSSLRNASGIGRYRRRVEIPHDWAGRSIVLVMEGVFHETTILVDAAPVASHGDGWTPIEVDLTEALAGKRTFVLGVDARVPDDLNGAGARLSLKLIGKQDWYGLMGGIWKPAHLEARNAVHLAEVAVRTSFDLKTGLVTVSGKLSRAAEGTTLRVTLPRGGEAVARLVFHFRSADFEAALAVPEAAPWSPGAPNLTSPSSS